MASKISLDLIDDVVERCKALNKPVPGIFWLAQINVKSDAVNSNIWPATKILLNLMLKDPGAAFVLHDNEAIRQSVKQLGVEIVRDPMGVGLQAVCAPSYGLDTGIAPVAWSMIGWLIQRRNYASDVERFMLDAASILGGLPGLQAPGRMPVHEPLILPRGMAEPLGQWIPAFRDSEGRTHDLIDLSLVKSQPANFSMLCRVFSGFSQGNSEEKGGYLARQAARVYDIAVHEIMPKDLEKAKRNQMPIQSKDAYTGIDSACYPMIGQALIQGAKLTQEAWSGPSDQPNQRPLTTQDGDLRELVYTVVAAKTNNEMARSDALKRMAEEGHDVVIAHRDHPKLNDKHARLPLHMCAALDQLESVRTLLSMGADTKANEHRNGQPQSLMEVISPMSAQGEQIKVAIRSCDARQAAMDAIGSMALEGVRVPAPE